ncbi:MAG TPA: metalloregulator ArsR/SmtB family transcription factor [Candidatus Eremiobacteraceae bacterium]|nr:metalloregulator ArsR/SmtB family transcription factor [Candidatus Eremiobacteraceae bacterium]
MSIQRCAPSTKVVDGDFDEAALLFKALGDPHRLAILATLARAQDEVCVCDFTAGLPLEQPTVSHHLRLLREAGLVRSQRRGTWVYYRLAPGVIARLRRAVNTLFSQKVAAA